MNSILYGCVGVLAVFQEALSLNTRNAAVAGVLNIALNVLDVKELALELTCACIECRRGDRLNICFIEVCLSAGIAACAVDPYINRTVVLNNKRVCSVRIAFGYL